MNELPTTFDAVLAAENDGYHALITLLHDETRALCAGDIGVLERQADAKLAQVRWLERLFGERQRLVARRPASASPSPDTESALALLHERAGEAKRLNALNGRLIDRRQQYTSRSLAALRDATGQPALYGADGQSSHPASAMARATA
jgi:flagellar biosynthesis/type III secretory pathway chaperone